MSSIDDLKKQAEAYSKRYGDINLHWTPLWDIQTDFDKTWTNNERPGCYAIFDGDMNLLYIGKADKMGSRLGSHFRKDHTDPSGKKGVLCKPEQWKGEPKYVLTVAVDKNYEASSLEEFLIQEVKPLENIKGNKNGIGEC